jgi:folate-binding protein YgfZ
MMAVLRPPGPMDAVMHEFFNLLSPAGTTPVHCTPLDSLRVFGAHGADAVSFLHRQLTNDIAKLPATEARFAGYCTARGRLLATTVVWRAPDADSVMGLVRAGLIDSVVKRLGMFVLRAKVSLDQPRAMVAGVTTEPSQLATLSASVGVTLPTAAWARVESATGTWITAPHAASALRWWWVATPEQASATRLGLASLMSWQPEATWQSADLACGLPWIDTATLDMFIPQTVNLDLVGGVNFTKGCYPGQEIVARTHYLGKVKRRMALGHIMLAVNESLPGQDVFDAQSPDSPCGRIVDAAGAGQVTVLFETRLDALEQSDLRLGSADGPTIEPAALPYSWA